MRPDLTRLLAGLTPLIGTVTLADEDIGDACFAVLQSIVSFDHSVIFAYRGDQRPLDLYATFAPDDYEVYVSLYQDGPYLLDPFFRAALVQTSGLFRMRDLAPDRFFSSEYYRSYYEKTLLAEELGLFVPIDGFATIVVSLMRKTKSGAFTASEFQQIQRAEPMIRRIVEHYWAGVAQRFDTRPKKARDRSAGQTVATRLWKKLNLTDREIAIVELVLQGHSSESIGLTLGIAHGTVKVHRRNIYGKLGISSQTQLLSLYLERLRDA